MLPDQPPDWVRARREIVGGRIRAAREHANFTQEQLAEQVRVDGKTIHRIEYAISDPPLTTLFLIAHTLGVPLADLVADGPEPQ